jgi:branched-chain amino acid transport system permease protein/urea transport system permease protein
METFVIAVLSALSLISILALVSIGMAIIFGMMNVINLAHGEFLTIGAYTAALATALTGSFWIGLALAPLVGAAAGLAMEVSIIRHLYRRPIDTIIATFGISLIIQKTLELTFGPSPIGVADPLAGPVEILGVTYPLYRIFLIVFALAVVGVVLLVFHRTNLGLDLRSTIQDSDMAAALGVDVARTYRIAFAAGAGLAALAGALIAPITATVPGMGLAYLIKSFFVVIVGGMGSILGVVTGSTFIGGFETAFSVELGGAFPQALVLVLAIVVVRLRPKGLVSS